MELLTLLGLIAAGLLFATPIAAFVALSRTRKHEEELERLRAELVTLRRRFREMVVDAPPAPPPPAQTRARAQEEAASASRVKRSAPEPAGARPTPGPVPPTTPTPDATRTPSDAPVAGGPAAGEASAGPSVGTPPAPGGAPGEAAGGRPEERTGEQPEAADGQPAHEEAPAGGGGSVKDRSVEELFPWAQGQPAGGARGPGAGAGAGGGRGRADRAGHERPGREWAAAAAAPEGRAALDFETLIGSTWLLRIGLGILAIALALFARSIVPTLPAGAKVALAYAGAILLFGTGKVFESSLTRFARPVMAAGLTFGFFVAFASYFVPAMSAVPLPASLAWMVLSMGTVLVAAERWESQWTAALAVLLGHVSAFVSAGTADTYSLVMIAFLAATAGVLVLRHDWLALGLFAIAASYGSHLLWLLADRAPISGDLGFWLNLSFLTAYYAVFLAVDVIWWTRDHGGARRQLSEAQDRLARQIGPANLVLYASLASFAYLATGAGLDTIEWFYLTLGAVQGGLAWYYWTVEHRDYVFYPAFGTVLWTLGWFAAFDALALNLVLAAQALLLLLAAHHTRLLVFHALAQLALAVSFVNYLASPLPAGSGIAVLLGGLGIAGVYILKASLEEVWYGEEGHPPWDEDAADTGEADGSAPHLVARVVTAILEPIAPYLASFHALLGGIVLVRELTGYFDVGVPLAVALVLSGAAIAGLVLFRARGALLFALASTAFGAPYVALIARDDTATLLVLAGFALVALALVHLADTREREAMRELAAAHAEAVVGLVLVGLFFASASLDRDTPLYLPFVGVSLLILVLQERLMAGGYAAKGELRATAKSRWSAVSMIACVLAGLSIVGLVAATVGPVATAPLWIAGWSLTILAASRVRDSAQLFVAGYALLLSGYWGTASMPGVWVGAMSTLWIGAIVVAVPLALALAMDRTIHERVAAGREVPGPAGPMTYVMFGVGLFLGAGLADAQLGPGWSLVAPAALGLALVAGAGRLHTARATPSVVVMFVALHLIVLSYFAGGTDVGTLLAPLLTLSLATLLCERAMGTGPGEGDSGTVWRRARLGLVVLATATAMAGIYESVELGPRWATAGWSVLGVSLMSAGFALRSADHRRVALVVLGACLLRVFLVDTRGLSDTERTIAFFVLGLCLVGAAWLYSRYSEELKSWL